MYFSLPVSTAILFLGASLSLVDAHGDVYLVEANGKSVRGANPYGPANQDTVTRMMYKHEGDGAYNLPRDFNNPAKMSCENSGPAPKSLTVSAGSTVRVHWVGATGELSGKPGTGGVSDRSPWVHAMGPVSDFLASCNGDCSQFDATNAGWTRIAVDALDMSASIGGDLRSTMSGKPEPYFPKGQGLWGMAKLVQDGSRRDVKIPAQLKSGGYLLRQELIAVHSPGAPQMYVSCIQLNVIDGGDVSLPKGTNSAALYSADGILGTYDVYSGSATDFKMPGPATWDGASSGDDSSDSGSNNSDSQPEPSSDNNNANDKGSEGSGGGQPTFKVCKRRNHRRRAMSVGSWY